MTPRGRNRHDLQREVKSLPACTKAEAAGGSGLAPPGLTGLARTEPRQIRLPCLRVFRSMSRIVAYTAALALAAGAAVGLSACGGSSNNSSSSGSGASKSAGAGDTVSLKSVSGVGTVLVDSKGFALYSPDQERSGTIRCTGSCTAVWVPLTLAKGVNSATAPSSLMSKLGTVMRPDGKTQVTFDGKPLYRFLPDGSPGKVTGNDASDQFSGRSFTWHVVSTGKTQTTTTTTPRGY
jgi:predicted lipoprotein with Yx(FWY)xxD motif